jgi:hypothetical protein
MLDETDPLPPPEISVVIPMHNEEGSVEKLYERLCAVLEAHYPSFEIIFVDDASRDRTYQLLTDIAAGDSRVTVIKLKRNFGQTPALAAGFDYARGDIIVSMDGDLQHDPSDLPALVEPVYAGYDLASGWRHKRIDNLVLRRIPSRVANWLMAKLSGVELHDFGTTFKAYRRDTIKRIRLYGELRLPLRPPLLRGYRSPSSNVLGARRPRRADEPPRERHAPRRARRRGRSRPAHQRLGPVHDQPREPPRDPRGARGGQGRAPLRERRGAVVEPGLPRVPLWWLRAERSARGGDAMVRAASTRAALVAALALAACGPSGEGYPYLRGDGCRVPCDDAGVDAGELDAGPPDIPDEPLEDWDEESAGPLTGIFAVEVTIPARAVVEVETRQLYRLRVVQRGEEVRMKVSPCRFSLASVPSVATLTIPPRLEAILREISIEDEGPFLSAADPIGTTVTTPRAVILLGADLTDPERDPLPTVEMPETALDQDEDGHPGVTVFAETVLCRRPEELYLALRASVVMRAEVTALDRFEGLVEPTLEQSVLGVSERPRGQRPLPQRGGEPRDRDPRRLSVHRAARRRARRLRRERQRELPRDRLLRRDAVRRVLGGALKSLQAMGVSAAAHRWREARRGSARRRRGSRPP